MPSSRDARTTLAARRLTSHSHGAGSVSSKSLMSNSSCRSGLAKPPKFATWQSPHACTRIPVAGVLDKSHAITAAEPRKNAKGDCRIRPYRIGKSSGRRPRPECRSTLMGSGRAEGADHSAWEVRETLSRRAFPWLMRTSILGPRTLDPSRRIPGTFPCWVLIC